MGRTSFCVMVGSTLLVACHASVPGSFSGIHGRGPLRWSSRGARSTIVTDRGLEDLDLTANQRRSRLGGGRAAPMSSHRSGLDGVLLVGTDGLFKYASREKIATAVRGLRPEEAPASLIELVRVPSGALPDDVGIVVVAPM